MTVSLHQHTIHYHRFGSGPVPMVCLHGYGENGKSFEDLGAAFRESHTLICPDLPLHGHTQWLEGQFHPGDLDSLITTLLEAGGFASGKFVLAGYSMGGRLALAYAEHFSQKLEGLLLIAPDGLKVNKWYWLATQTSMGNRFFKFTMHHPQWFFNGMTLARKAGLLNQSIYKFAHHYLDDPLARKQLYERWTLMRRFKPDLNAIREKLNLQQIPLLLVFGKHDRIIVTGPGKRFMQGIGKNANLLVLEAGHRLLRPNFCTIIAASFQSLEQP
ncbi:alpha/beta hydrolase [Flavihumibacter rivuli]|uniref:alpha/beta fold hydrolase n=1 Tax=Flavihumibacter rivuli TaxID=2838156 RepID=UPI001BDF4550|nr:alpha/beta hydrolase [Flavihumibacter rivuli]ULQ55516.1 alpha/beta hydrolase [Flavihumibacter rivuli]